MNTSVIGYPRIGKDRELKFASEKFFNGELDEAGLLEVAKQIRKEDLLIPSCRLTAMVASSSPRKRSR